MDWIRLVDLKESYLVQLAECTITNGIEDELAFKQQVPSTLKKRDRIISKVKAKNWRTTHKFGIRVPKSVNEAYEIDRLTGTNFQTKVIEKEMQNMQIVFEKKEGATKEEMESGKVIPGYKYVTTRMIFNIKMDRKFTRKARLVTNRHKTDAPASITYSSVISRDSIRICLMAALLNGLYMLACNISNAYLKANCWEKLWTVAGAKFSSNNDTMMIISRVLYSLKSSRVAWRTKLAQTMDSISYKPSQADLDVWMKVSIKKDSTLYYKYMLVYVDYILHIAKDPKEDMKLINEIYRLKEGIGPLDRYLGGTMKRVQLSDGRLAQAINCVGYLKGAILNIDNLLKESNLSLKLYGDGKRLYPSSYCSEMDVMSELDAEMMNRF